MTLKKDELLLIVKHYKLEDIKRSMRKAAICKSLLKYFVEQEIFEEGEVEFLEETEDGSKATEQLVIRKMEYELELKRMEMEEKQKDREMEDKQKAREMEETEKQAIGIGSGRKTEEQGI